MKIKRLLTLLLLTACGFPAMAQVNEEKETYQGIKVASLSDLGNAEPLTISILPLGNGIIYFRDAQNRTPLNGTYRFIVHKNKYYVGEISKGLAHGQWEEHFYGKLYEKATYKNGELDGKLMQYNHHTSEAHYAEYTVEKGVFLHYVARYENGQVKEERFFKNGRRHGNTQVFDENGNVVGEANYENGVRQGRQMSTSKKGEAVSQEYRNGKKHGEYVHLYANGNLKEKGYYDDKQLKTGQWLYGQENGDLEKEENYRANKLHGSKREYYKGNRLKSEEEYDDGRLSGNVVYYDEEPYQKTSEGTFLAGKRHGVFRVYHDGILWRESIYSENKEVGKKEYAAGKLQILKLLDATGSMVEVEKYDNSGKQVYKNQSYKKHTSVKLKEDAHGVIDIEF